MEKFKKLIQLIHWSSPDEKIESQYGVMRIDKWLKKEKARIESDPERIAKIVNKKGKTALFVDNISGA